MFDITFSKNSGIRNWIKSRSLIETSFLFRGLKSDFINKLKITNDLKNKSIKFYLSKLHDDSFQITDVSSVGTGITNFMPNKGITIYGEINSLNNNIQVIHIKSKFRFEIYLLLGVAIFFYLTMILSKGTPLWVYPIPLLPIPWFIWIYKIQTDGLVNKIKNYFNLEPLGNDKKTITTT
jgi:hypothetical protein